MAQSRGDVEVVVVDDASDPPVRLAPHRRLKLIRLDANRGHAAARNIGARAAAGAWLTFLDDDDQLLPDMVAVSLEAATSSSLSPPVAVTTGLQWVGANGEVVATRRPPYACARAVLLSGAAGAWLLVPGQANAGRSERRLLGGRRLG
ncbi:MAG: glycosyltransferase [Gammaproteobacteria bacterium]|nr:glycosyltransferase [Gammaproteobacteria bacterium]